MEQLMDFPQFMQWAFLGLMGSGVTILGFILMSLNRLNIQIAVVISRLDNHDKRIEKLEDTQ